MSDQLKVYCKNIEEYIPFKGGDTLMDIYNTIADRIPEHPICAHVNNKTEDLQFPLPSKSSSLLVKVLRGIASTCAHCA